MHKYKINPNNKQNHHWVGGKRGQKLIEHMGLDFVSAFKNIWILNTELHTVLVLKPQKGPRCIVKHKIHSHNKEKQQNNKKLNGQTDKSKYQNKTKGIQKPIEYMLWWLTSHRNGAYPVV